MPRLKGWEKKIQSFRKDKESSKILANVFWLFSDKILRYGIGLFVSIWVANYLGSARFGNYNVAMAYMYIFSAVSTLGLKGVVTRELVKYPEKEGELLGSAFLLTVIGSLVAFFASVLTAYVLSPNDTEGLLLVAVVSGGLLFQGAQVFNYYYSAKVLSKYVVYASNSAYLASSLLKIYGIYNEQDLIFFAWVIFFDSVISSMMLSGFYFFHRKKQLFSWRVTTLTAKNLLYESLPLVLAGIMVSIYMKVDQIMLKELSTEDEAGLYAVAVKLTELWYFVPVIIQSSVFPNLTKSKELGERKLLGKFAKLFSFISIFSGCVIVSTLFFGRFVLDTFFSDEYIDVLPMLYLSIFALLFVGLGTARNSYLLIKELTVYTLYFTILGAVMNVMMNWYLIPKYGGSGAAISTVVSYAFSAFVSTFFVRELRPIGLLMARSMFRLKS